MPFDSLKAADEVDGLAGHPLASLSREDLDLITEMVMVSGSLKHLAMIYGVSYPTIRSRLDKVIGRLGEAVAGRRPDPLSELLATLVERGEITVSAARSVRDLIRAQAARAVPPGSAPFPAVTDPKGDRP